MGVPAYVRDLVLIAILCVVLVFQLLFEPLSSAVLIGAAVLGCAPLIWRVLRAFADKEWISMDLLAGVALLFALLSRAWESAIFIEIMLAAARILDAYTSDRTEKNIRSLLQLRPTTAKVLRDNAMMRVAIADVRRDDIVEVGTGERVPVDGEVVSGTCAIDESSLTGESMPKDKREGDLVLASTLVQWGTIRFRATRIGTDTTIERVIALVAQARSQKPKTQTLGERFGKIYLVAIFVGAAALLAFTQDVLSVLAVVLVVCADDIAIAIPITYLNAIRTAASRGVLVKGSSYLEALGTIRTVVFDKTGTLTEGRLAVADVYAPTHTRIQLLKLAGIAAQHSTHPVSRAISAQVLAEHINTPVSDASHEIGGMGIAATHKGAEIVVGREQLMHDRKIGVPTIIRNYAARKTADGFSVVFVGYGTTVIGCIAFVDVVRESTTRALHELRALGITKIIMLTGDSEEVAASVAKELGVDAWHSKLLPQDKLTYIRELQASEPIAMIGDGVNDAAALSLAAVGISMGGLGSEGAIESSQIVLMRDDLTELPHAIALARKARAISIQDFWIWGLTNAFGLALVFTGIIGPVGAAVYNFLSDFLPLFNSLRARVSQK